MAHSNPDLDQLSDDELLDMRLCDLKLQIKGTSLEPKVEQLNERKLYKQPSQTTHTDPLMNSGAVQLEPGQFSMKMDICMHACMRPRGARAREGRARRSRALRPELRQAV